MKRLLFLLLILLFYCCIQAQNLLGVVNSEYSGVSKAFINPASILNSRKYFDLVLAEGNTFGHNNYLYIPAEDYTFRKLVNFDFPTYPNGASFLDNYTTDPKNAYVDLRLTGLSLMLTINRHAFALLNSARSISSVHALPYHMAKFMYEGLDFVEQQNIRYSGDKKTSGGSLSWFETGLTYAYTFQKYDDNSLSFGVTAKRLWAYHGLQVSSSNYDYMVPDSDNMTFYDLNAVLAFSLPLDYSTNDFLGFDDPIRGRGFSADLGFTYVRTIKNQSTRKLKKICEYPYEPILYSIGVSLLDLGLIRFNTNVERLVFENIDTTWTGLNSVDFESVDDFVNQISTALGGSPDAFDGGTEFQVALPTALSLQFDYNFENNLKLNVVLVQDLPLLNNRISRPSYLSIAPRYALRHFEITTPFTLYRYTEPRLGLALRFYNLTVGTDKIGSYLGFPDFYGIDFYFSIQIGILKGNCGRRAGGYNQCSSFQIR